MLNDTKKLTSAYVPCVFIQISDEHIRQILDDYDIESFSSLVRRNGILKAINVTYVNDECYILTEGLRRFLAAKKIGFSKVPCNISYTDLEQGQKAAIIDQLSSKDLHYLDQSIAFKKLFDFGFKVEQIASMVNLSTKTVYNTANIANIPKEYRDLALIHGWSKKFVISLIPKCKDIINLKKIINNKLLLKDQSDEKLFMNSFTRYMKLSLHSAERLVDKKLSPEDLFPLYHLSLKISDKIHERLKDSFSGRGLATNRINDGKIFQLTQSFPTIRKFFKIILASLYKNSLG